MNTFAEHISKAIYAGIFLIIIPGILLLWARYTEAYINLPVFESSLPGWILLIAGIALMAWAMYFLKKFGKGLPMNAFPPPKLVTKGPFLFLEHPIYWGFALLITGYFIITKSASGLWMVAPLTILSMIALVWGYEAIDLKKRFPDQSVRTLSDLPENTKELATVRERVVSLGWVVLLLLLSNLVVAKLVGQVPPFTGRPLSLPFSIEIPYLNVLAFLFVGVVPFIIKRRDLLRNWAITCLIGLSISTFVALLYPSVGAQFLMAENSTTYTVPVLLVLLSDYSLFKQSKGLGLLLGLPAAVLIILQLSHSSSALLHLSSAVLISLLALNYFHIWMFLKNTSEKVANSWKEWVFGKVRVINHGFYVGFGSFLGILLTGILVGDEYAWAILMFAVVVVVFSALWAQIIEGSEKLKRPYGYYGALVGIVFASLAVWAMGYNGWVLIGAISVMMPWVQGIGRFRCLVNGCCHGGKVDNSNIGIRYFHYRSRVCGISHLKGELIHPTPLYSMIWLFLVGFILLALWRYNCSPPFIFGIYLILTGIGRFVEEAYRGEVQTPVLKGLRLYQWTAILSVLIGISMTLINIEIVLLPSEFGWQTMVSALLGGLFTLFAMGIDFPESNARFSRLV